MVRVPVEIVPSDDRVRFELAVQTRNLERLGTVAGHARVTEIKKPVRTADQLGDVLAVTMTHPFDLSRINADKMRGVLAIRRPDQHHLVPSGGVLGEG